MAKKNDQNKGLKFDLNNEVNQAGLSAAIFIFALVILVVVVIRPNIVAISDNQTRLTEREEALTALETKVRQLNGAYENYNQASSKLGLLTEAIPDNTRLRETLAIIEKNASDVVVQGQEPMAIINISIENTPDVVPLNENGERPAVSDPQRQDVQIMVSVRGNYSAVRDFILRLKNDRRNFQVSRLSLVAPETSSGSVLDVMITLNHFYYGDYEG